MKLGFKLVGVVALVTTVSVLGCGKSRRSAPEASPRPEVEEQANIDEGHLDLFRVMPASANRELPERSAGRPIRLIREGSVWIARDVIRLSDAKPTDRAWPEATFGERIVGAIYSVSRREAGEDGSEAQPARRDVRHVSFDDETRRWFVSVEEVIGAAARDTGPGRIHRLRLELLFEGGRHRRFDIEFQAIGPVPPVALEGGDQVIEGNPDVWMNVAKMGPIAYQKRLSNPTQRPLRAWVRVWGIQPSWISTSIDQVSYHGGPPQEVHSLRVQDGTFKLSTLEGLLDGDARQFDVALEEGAWIGIDLPAGRTLTLRLRATTVDWRPCSWPGPVERVFRWNDIERRCEREYSEARGGSRLVCWDVPHPREERRTEHWAAHGARLRSEFSLDVRLADPSVSAESVAAARDDDGLRTLVGGAAVVAVSGAGAEPTGSRGQGCEFGHL